MCANENPVTLGQTHIHTTLLTATLAYILPQLLQHLRHNQICPTGQAAVSFAQG